jgi:hypothetical protein
MQERRAAASRRSRKGLTMTPLTASAGTPHGAGVTVGEIRHVVVKYLTEHPELLRQVAPPHMASTSATLSISNRETVNASGGHARGRLMPSHRRGVRGAPQPTSEVHDWPPETSA